MWIVGVTLPASSRFPKFLPSLAWVWLEQEQQSKKADCVKAVCSQHAGLRVRVNCLTVVRVKAMPRKGPVRSLLRPLSWKREEWVLPLAILPPASRPQLFFLFEQDLAGCMRNLNGASYRMEVRGGGRISLGQCSLTKWQNSDDISGPFGRVLGSLSPESLTWWKESVQTTCLGCLLRSWALWASEPWYCIS